MLVDTHAHLNFSDYSKNLDEVIKRSTVAGVTKIVCASSNLEDSIKSIEIAKRYPKTVFAAVGIHPQQTDPDNKTSLINQIKELTKLVTENKITAIGECGLDYSVAPPPELDRTEEEQVWLFREQIKLAQRHNLPLLIHSRKSFDQTVEILTDFHKLQGVFHCYSGGKKGIDKVRQLGFSAKGEPASGWYFGVDGNLTYDEGLQNVFNLIPIENIVLETDCPFLAPVPYRGQKSEPAHILLIAQTLAKIKSLTPDKVFEATSTNARKLFSI